MILKEEEIQETFKILEIQNHEHSPLPLNNLTDQFHQNKYSEYNKELNSSYQSGHSLNTNHLYVGNHIENKNNLTENSNHNSPTLTNENSLNDYNLDQSSHLSFSNNSSHVDSSTINKNTEHINNFESQTISNKPVGESDIYEPIIGKLKMKKKDVLKTVQDKIKDLISSLTGNDFWNENVEKVALKIDMYTEAVLIKWKLLEYLVQNDGSLVGSYFFIYFSENAYISVLDILSFNKTLTKNATPLDSITQFLIKADFSGACNYCIKNKLWTHAIVFATRLGPTVYNDTLKAFCDSGFTENIVDSKLSEDREILKLFYEVLSGNGILYRNSTFYFS